MQADAFVFFRGSAPWFYEQYGRDALLRDSPAVWLRGDAHVENFGSYRGGNGLVYFDANDFDEAVRGPLLWDVVRLTVSVKLAGAYLGLTPSQQQATARAALGAYTAALARGNPFLLERETATGVVRQFIKKVARRRHRDLLRVRARRRHGWHLRSLAALCPLPEAERREVLAAFEERRGTQAVPPCGPALDVAQRVAGIGSLGVPRYAVLAEHHRAHKWPVLLGRGELYVLDGNSWKELLHATPRRVALTGAGQTEGATFKDDHTLLLTTEQGAVYEYQLL